MTAIKQEDLIQIDMQVTELSTTLSKEMGIDWGNGGANNPLNLTYTEGNGVTTSSTTSSSIESPPRSSSASIARVPAKCARGRTRWNT